MKTSKRVFIKEANDLFQDMSGRKVSGDILIHEFKSSEVWAAYDMIKYRMEDTDRTQMAIWDSGEVFPKGNPIKNEGRDYLNEIWESDCKKMIRHTERLLAGLNEELKSIPKKFELPNG